MTIEGQLHELARHIDEHQPVITAAEIVQRASGQLLDHTSPDDATASRPHLTIARLADSAASGPIGDARMSENTADSENATRWRIPAVAAMIVVVGVGAIAFAVSNTNSDDPERASQAPAPTAAPTTAAPTTTDAPRSVTSTAIPDVRITYTLPDGWAVDDSTGSVLGESSTVNFWNVGNVYADGCDHTLLDPRLGPTVDDLANVWATLPGFTATTPVDIIVDGYAGKRVDYTVPEYPTVAGPNDGGRNADCAGNTFALWDGFWAQTPGQQNRQWIIDVNGTRVVINEWSQPGTTPEQLADMEEFLASIQIG